MTFINERLNDRRTGEHRIDPSFYEVPGPVRDVFALIDMRFTKLRIAMKRAGFTSPMGRMEATERARLIDECIGILTPQWSTYAIQREDGQWRAIAAGEEDAFPFLGRGADPALAMADLLGLMLKAKPLLWWLTGGAIDELGNPEDLFEAWASRQEVAP